MYVANHLTREKVLYWEKQLSKPADVKRFRALSLAMKGWIAKDIAEALEVNLRTVQAWIHKYNEHGPQALLNKTTDRSRQRYLVPALEQLFIARVLAGPTDEDGFGRFTAKNLAVILQEEFDAHYHYKAVYDVLKRLGLSWITGRKENERKRKKENARFLEEAPFLSEN